MIVLTDYLIKPLILICGIASVLSLIYLASSGNRWIRIIINGVERIVLASAAGTVIYDYWGRYIFGPGDKGPGPGSGSGSGNNTGGGSSGTNRT